MIFIDVAYASILITQVDFCDTYELSYKIPLLSEYAYARIWLVYSQERSYKDGAPHHGMMLSFRKRGPIRMVRPTMK